MSKLLFSVVLLSIAISEQGLAQTVDFQRDVAPILEERCCYCHGEDEQESGLRLDRRGNMLRGGDSGLATIVPGKPNESYLLEVIAHLDPDVKMPPDDEKLPASEIQLLTRWIEQGAMWPGQMDAVVEERTEHWSFQRIERPAVPADSPAWNPIDAFLLKSLAAKGLTFSESADPRSLLRRASLVLTGLPPTPAETNEFLAACHVDFDAAYSALIDRLLNSPHFGERWAQHWLDVIRWAETNGSESNLYRKNAWIYRDYVVRSFNEDKPYDQFLFEQIAGDTVGKGDATGYLVSGPYVPVATVGQEPSARRQARADRMDEILQTVGASALGLTIGCARCHNHKFDPISIRDYYSMSAVFQDVEFGSRFPELAADHPRRLRGQELYGTIAKLHQTLGRMGPWEEDWIGYRELHFPKTTTTSVRVTFDWNSVRVDELEIFGTQQRNENLALASVGTIAESPKEMEVNRGEIRKINDGLYGTEAWGAKVPKDASEKPWVQLTFTEPQEINRVRLSTNRAEFLETDYLEKMSQHRFGSYRVEVLEDDGSWRLVADTASFGKLNQKHPTRAANLERIQKQIAQVAEQGPKPSFIGRFIEPVRTHVFARGSPENPRDEVFAAGPSQLDGELELSADAPGRERRIAFADWLASVDHPLTARVYVNRLWHHVFGQGIVTTTSDFGAAGALPSHPELLDWLAVELMQPSASGSLPSTHPWSTKHLIRMMVMSQAFRQANTPNEHGLAVDANAALLWRFPPRRVEAEVIRDSILLASGSLDRTLGGRSYRIHNVKKRYSQWEVVDNHGPESWRRMLYQERMRRVDDQLFTAFDFPDCGQVRAKRPVSTTPLQALNLMNSDFVIDQSERIAQRAQSDADGGVAAAIDRCFQLLLGREPDDLERKACVRLAAENDLSLVARALINSNEFAFLP